MTAWVMCPRNSTEATVQERVSRRPENSLGNKEHVPCSYSMGVQFKLERNEEKLLCFEQRRKMEQLFFFLMKRGTMVKSSIFRVQHLYCLSACVLNVKFLNSCFIY